MNQSTKISLIVGGVLIVLAGVIGITFAYFSTGGVQDTANTFNSGCLNISLTNESTSINLTDAYPITDAEGLETTSYDFTVKNNCNSATNYQINLESLQINLESLNEQVNSLNADYIKVSLSSDTVDNVISILSSNTSVTPTIDNAYESYNLYTDSLEANEEKTYHLKIWVDYDATVEQAASKTYTSKINVIANPETTVVDTLEVQFSIKGTTATATLTENVTSATYCTTTGNICTPSTSATISNNSYTVELEELEQLQVICTQLNGTSKIICSDGLDAKKVLLNEAILANATTQTTRTDFSTTVEETTTGTIYYADTSKGRTYYFAGNPTDNWVRFAGFYWRIIRINEDGSIRLIYNGTGTGTTGTSTQLQTSAFEYTYGDNTYVGYMMGLDNQCPSGSCSGSTRTSSYNQSVSNSYDSMIKGVLDDWYEKNLQSHADKISTEAGFCGDRTYVSGKAYGISITDYGAYNRLYINKTPSFECTNTTDLYTVSSANSGNKALDYPIGLITADEVAYAGGVYGQTNNGYYLYTNQYYWTMSPYRFDGSNAVVFRVNSSGNLNDYYVRSSNGVRPVINLKANTKFQGSGTESDPYVVSS